MFRQGAACYIGVPQKVVQSGVCVCAWKAKFDHSASQVQKQLRKSVYIETSLLQVRLSTASFHMTKALGTYILGWHIKIEKGCPSAENSIPKLALTSLQNPMKIHSSVWLHEFVRISYSRFKS